MTLTIFTGPRGDGKAHRTLQALVAALPPGSTGAIVTPEAVSRAWPGVVRVTGGAGHRSGRIDLPNGTTLHVLGPRSAFNLRRMRCAAVAMVGADKLSKDVATWALAATRTGAHLFIATEPPQTERGEWVARLVEAVRSGEVKGEIVECGAMPTAPREAE